MPSARPFDGTTVLVVDDDAEERRTVGALLESLGARVMLAADGREALARLQQQRPDLVLCDIRMPHMDGLEFAEHVRRDPRYRDLRLIALTGLQSDADLRRTWSVGFDGHLPKPATAEAFIALRRRLSGSSDAAGPVA
jgi:CheY-like chemotaxis protein